MGRFRTEIKSHEIQSYPSRVVSWFLIYFCGYIVTVQPQLTDSRCRGDANATNEVSRTCDVHEEPTLYLNLNK